MSPAPHGTTESALDPRLEIIDPHIHLWNWPGAAPYQLDDLQRDTSSGHQVVGTVFVECGWGYRTTGKVSHRPIGEIETITAIAESSAATGTEVRGIVGYADLRLGAELDEILDEQLAVSHGRFRGIRHTTAFDDDPEIRPGPTDPPPTPAMMADPAFVDGVRTLAGKGLTFDAWIYHPQIDELTALADAVPECTIVLDHLGGMIGAGRYAGARDSTFAQWRVSVAALAQRPNVMMKLGGLGMSLSAFRPTAPRDECSSDDLAQRWRDPIIEAIELFGSDRCMFESNFPVDGVRCTYVTLWNAFKKIAAGCSPSESAALFRCTAERVYQLEEEATP